MRTLCILAVAIICFAACRSSNNNYSNMSLIHKWNLETLPDTAFSIPDGMIYVQFNANGTVNGEGGCNGFSGNYTVSGTQLYFRDLMSTLIWCDYGKLETKFMNALNKTNSYAVTNGVLNLYHDGVQVASLSMMQ